MRIAGAVLIFMAFLTAGLSIVDEKKRRRDDLSELCFALELICSELGTNNTALPELVSVISQRTTKDVCSFFVQIKDSFAELGNTPFSSLWAAAADTSLSILTPEQLCEIKKLGCVIGRYELSRQLSATEATLKYFNSQSKSARNNLPEERRICLGLAASAGAMLAILFI